MRVKLQSLMRPQYFLLLIALALIPFFQNMSVNKNWKDGEFDIREIAPQKPEGYSDQSFAQYMPQNFSGHSFAEFQQSMLSHNLDPMLKNLEIRYLQPITPIFNYDSSRSLRGPASVDGTSLDNGVSGGVDDPFDRSSAAWKLSLLSPQKMRLSYSLSHSSALLYSGHEEKPVAVNQKNLRFICEANTKENSVQLGLTQELSSHTQLGVSHQTGDRQSQLHFDYTW